MRIVSRTILLGAVLIAVVGGGCDETPESNMTSSRETPTDAGTTDGAEDLQTATFAAGCFWGVEVVFRRVPGVTDAEVGYTGGHTQNPTYKQVCSDRTGHAEAVTVTFDPRQVSYEELLTVFWNAHNPTTPNRQGPDIGSQYRSAVFFHTSQQEAAARKSLAERQKKLSRPIVTQIVPAGVFWRAEEYHQQYHQKNGGAACPS